MRRLFLLLDIFIVSQIAWAQCKLTVTVSFSGNCGGSLDARLQKAVSEQMAQHWNGLTFNSSIDCERAGLAAKNDISGSYGGCTAHVTVICGGCPRASKPGNIDVLGVSQGTTFYSTNSANEIRDWSSDDMERMLALNRNYQHNEPTVVSTGDPDFDNVRSGYMLSGSMPGGSLDYIEKPHDNNNQDLEDYMIVGGSRIPVSVLNKPFDSVNMREEQGNLIEPKEYYFGDVLSSNDERWNYFLEKEFTDELHSEYFREKQINIEEALYKDPRTEFDIELLSNYQKWKEQKLEEAEILKDMAICSALSYAGDNSSLEKLTDYKLVKVPSDEAMNPLMLMINSCNEDDNNQGFHADIFFNVKTKEYTISFRGTEMTSWKDWETNKEQGMGNVPTQYKMAIEIGDVVKRIKEQNPEIKINITGHSLGGGLATIAGVVSGQPTYVFNPAGVHKNTFEYAGVTEKIKTGDLNITRISEKKDILTNSQENPSLNTVRDGARALFFVVDKCKTKDEIASANYAEALLPAATGNLKTIDTGITGLFSSFNAHRIVPMANNLIERYNTIQNTMKESTEIPESRIYYRN